LSKGWGFASQVGTMRRGIPGTLRTRTN